MSLLFVCYSRCSTCQKAKRFLDARGVDYVERPIKEENPTASELLDWMERSGLEAKRFVNTSGQLYRSMGLKDRIPAMTREEIAQLLSTDGMLVKRPILVGEEFVLTGFREAEWEAALG